MRFISLFSGIGGFDLGFERAGMTCVTQIEKDDFCQKVLTKHWPDVPKYRDIRDVECQSLPPAEVIIGGAPCQPFSSSGVKRGAKDDRYLWPEMFRIIRCVHPQWVVFENVANLVRMEEYSNIHTDMDTEGYDTISLLLPASGIGAPHLRKRLFMVSNSTGGRCEKQWGFGSKKISISDLERFSWWASEPGVCRVANGVPNRMDRLRALGNAVVPQLAQIIATAIIQTNSILTNT